MTTDTLPDLTFAGATSRAMAELLAAAVRARLNVVITGPAGGGKSTLLRALAAHIPAGDRVGTVESRFELLLHERPDLYPANLIAMAERPASEDLPAVTMGEVLEAIQRHRVDRLIVDDVRSEAVLPVLDAMLSSHSTICTLRLDRLDHFADHLVAQVRDHHPVIPAATVRLMAAYVIDLIVHVRPRAGRHVITAIADVAGTSGADTLDLTYLWHADTDGTTLPTGHKPRHLDRLIDAGLEPALWAGGER